MGHSWGPLGAFWEPLEGFLEISLEGSKGVFGPRVDLGPSWGRLGAASGLSWALFGPPWPTFGRLLEILGRSWSLLLRSWGFLGPSRGRLEAVLGVLKHKSVNC